MSTPAWQRKAGKNPKGGLNEAGRRSAKKQGMNLKRPVKSGDNPRRASFLARMGNMPGPERKNGEPTRLLLSLNAWGADSKACLLYTSPSPRDGLLSRMPSSA